MASVPLICLTCLTLIQAGSVMTFALGMNLIVPKARTNYFKNSFASAGAKLWNSLPSSLKEETSSKQFKAKTRSYLLSTQAS